jgi:KGK domain
MQSISIAPKIYNRTRPLHQSNAEHDISTLNIFNHHKIMLDRSKQIIPDLNAVVNFFDQEILKTLDSHTTFTTNELLEAIKVSGIDRTSFRDELRDIILKSTQSGHSKEVVLNKLITFIDGDKINENRYTSYEILRKALLKGTECTLLQADEKGWQKGKLNICFEFIPEEDEDVATQKATLETHTSPLDEIRQLSNELASVGSIEQN